MKKEKQETTKKRAQELAKDKPKKKQTINKEKSALNEKKMTHTSFSDTLPQLKKYQRKKLWRRLATIVGILMIPLLITIYYVSPLSRLQTIQVTGNQTVKAQTIIKESKLAYDEDFLTQYLHRAQTVSAIKKANVRIDTVSIVPSSVNGLTIKVTEYSQIAQLSKGNEYYPILANGKMLDERTEKPTNGFVILEDFKDDNAIMQTIKAYETLPSDIQSAISQINATPTKANDSLLKLIMKDGNTVIVNIENLAKQLVYYPKVAKDLPDKGIIDMEVGIFYTPYPSEDKKDSDEIDETSTQSSSSVENQGATSSESANSTENVTNPQ